MKIIVEKTSLAGLPLEKFLRRAGYAYIRDRKTGQDSFVRRLGSGFYPRLHLYAEELSGEKISFNLHLDQKQASYEGAHMHSAEYDGEVVAGEIARLKEYIGVPEGGKSAEQKAQKTGVSFSSGEFGSDGLLKSIGHGDSGQESGAPEKKSWFGRLFK